MKQFIIGALMVGACAPAALAQDSGSSFSFDGYLGVVSDYRDRGLTLSDKDPAVIASLGLYHDNGLYVGASAGSISEAAGGDAKASVFAGYSFDAGDFIYDLSVELDSIQGNDAKYYPEISASVSRDFGLAFIRTGAVYAPDGRWSAPNTDSFYIYTDVEVPVPTMPELTIISRLGYDMRQNRADLWDYAIGLSAFIDVVEFSIMYEDSSLDQAIGGGAILGGIKLYF
ncbi:TorF family putative porin [Kordiimonas sp.]|uniref:TorF family putative porin n=1 Tax=Kordiimonas sp. TaxID=1970157 RepID=UPI003A934AD9